MVQLQENLVALKEQNVQVVGVSPDSVEILKTFADDSGVEFALLSDPDAAVIKSFGILNTENPRGLPHPGTILIDQQGAIRVKIFREGYRERHPAQELIDAAKGV